MLVVSKAKGMSQSRKTSTVGDEVLRPVELGDSTGIFCPESHVGGSRIGSSGCRSLETLLKFLALYTPSYISGSLEEKTLCSFGHVLEVALAAHIVLTIQTVRQPIEVDHYR